MRIMCEQTIAFPSKIHFKRGDDSGKAVYVFACFITTARHVSVMNTYNINMFTGTLI